MKKWLAVLLVVMLAYSLTGCGGKAETAKNDLGQENKAGEEIEPEGDKEDVAGEEDKEDEAGEGNTSETQPEVKDYKEGVIDASNLYIKNGVAFWGYGQQLCSALLDGSRNLHDFISEGTLNGEIHSIAIDGNDMYLSTEKGIVCMPLEEAEQGQSQVSVINEHELSTSSFQIYDGYLYFAYGKSLYSVPKDGGDEKVLEENIDKFQVTTNGIYCLNGNGDLICVSLDGTERKTLCELGSEGEISVQDDKAYITTGDDKDYVYVYDFEKADYEKLHFEKDLSPYYPVWVTKECLYYESDDFEIFCYDFQTGTETQSDVEYDLSKIDEGYLENNVLYYVLSDDLYWIHLDGGESFKMAKGEALGSNADNGTVSDTAEAESPSDDGTYNIAENIGIFNSEGQARLESKYFTLYLPADGDWIYQVEDNTTIGIYYKPAYDSGAGGYLVSIKAFDWGDNSYEDYPAYAVAGSSEDKKYIAIFPTDVQYEPDQEAGYRRMYDYVMRINDSEESAADNPFYCQ